MIGVRALEYGIGVPEVSTGGMVGTQRVGSQRFNGGKSDIGLFCFE